jgi:tRNA-modifying protein YgfZ
LKEATNYTNYTNFLGKMMSKTVSIEEAYEAAHDSAVLVDRSSLGMLQFSGQHRLDLIHRMSTQAVKELKSGEGVATVLTTDIGRMVDRIILYASSTSVYALTGENNSNAVARWLMRYVFFNDDFQIKELSAETFVYGVYGCRAAELLAAAGFGEGELPLHHWREVELKGRKAYLHRTDPLAGDGYFVTGHTADQETIANVLLATGIVPASEEAFEYLRIESGMPRFGRELTQEYIPLEANLWDDVSFKKGCYIGQEIIARMESRGRLAKKLMKLRPAGPIEAGVELTAGDKKAGAVTSAADGPNGPVALGYVKTAVLEGEVTLTAGETAIRLVE